MISTDEYFGFILPVIITYFNNKKINNIIEFGNSTWGNGWTNGAGKYGLLSRGKTPSDHPISFWKHNNIQYVPIDISGINSISLDLGKELPESIENINIKNNFDIMLDIGTIEHVKNQYEVWKNCHDVVKKEGLMLHSLPLVGWWKNHCYHWYTMNFFKQLAKKCNYEIIMLTEEKACRENFKENPDYQILVAYVKREENNFIEKEVFENIFLESKCETNFFVNKAHGIPNYDIKIHGENV